MLRPHLLVFAALLISAGATAQEQLVLYRTFGGAHFEYEKDTAVYQVTPKQVSQILFDHPQAYAEFKKARRSSTWSGILGFVGAGLIIVPTATAALGGDPEWLFAAGGAALIATSIPLGMRYRKKAQLALDLFNERQRGASLHPRTELGIGASGFRVTVRF